MLDELFAAGFALERADYDSAGSPTGTTTTTKPGDPTSDPLVAILATRNQAVDDATDVVERLRAKHGLTDTDLVSSTVDSWQGQTNGITVAIHPLTGASQLDEFNSAFGRLAVDVHPSHPRPADGRRDPASTSCSARRPLARARRSASPATASCHARPTNASSPRSPVAAITVSP